MPRVKRSVPVSSAFGRGELIVAAAGISLPFAFAPFGLFPLAVVAPTVLFHYLSRSTPGRAAWRGWLFGLGMFGVGVSWVVESFQYNNIPLSVALFLTTLFVVALALFPAGFAYVAARWAGGARPSGLILAYPALWTLFDWFRGGFLTGFTWLQLGYSQIDSWLVGLAPVTGVYGMSWAVALSAGLVVAAIRSRPRAAVAYLAVAAAVWAGAGALRAIQWTDPAGPMLRVALIQGAVPQALKWRPEQRQPTLDLYLGLTRRNWDADLVVWPETALPGLYQNMEGFLRGVEREARGEGTDLLVGVPYRDPETGRLFNSVVALGQGGGVYHKRHLVPFGEYLPAAWLFGPPARALGIPIPSFSHGPRDQPLLEVAGYRVGVSICYEAAFGREIIRALPGAAFLVNVSNDAWFGDSMAPHQHLQMARMRAVETGRYLVRATNTGISAIITPAGRIDGRSPQFEPSVLTGEIEPRRGTTPYARSGNLPVVAALFGLVVLGAWRGRAVRPRRQPPGR